MSCQELASAHTGNNECREGLTEVIALALTATSPAWTYGESQVNMQDLVHASNKHTFRRLKLHM
jgi:hypothetical protein